MADLKNRLLEALPTEEYVRLRPLLSPVDVVQEQILHHPDVPAEHVYFPQSAVLSYVFSTEDGVPLEVGMVGRNGMAGVWLTLDTERTPNYTEVLIGGTALRMSAQTLLQEVARGGTLPKLLHRSAQAAAVHSGQMQVCMRLHSMEVRLAGWLLLLHDLRPSDTLPLTQRAIGQMLGVRRQGVSDSAHRLQSDKLISYSRGRIVINDRDALQNFACNCYEVIHREYELVFAA